MINKPKGYDEAKVYTEQEKLPKGGYVIKILNTKVVAYSWGSVLVLQMDIAEGEQAGFYQKNYDNQTQEDKKWKGTFRINLPKDDGSEQDSWTIRSLKTNMTAIEQSNPGYTWDWDETKLKGKIVGALFNEKEYEFNGKKGFFTNCKRLIEAEKIRSGNYKLPQDDMLKGSSSQNMDIPEGFSAIDDEDIPF